MHVNVDKSMSSNIRMHEQFLKNLEIDTDFGRKKCPQKNSHENFLKFSTLKDSLALKCSEMIFLSIAE